jgi:hypothetical protein
VLLYVVMSALYWCDLFKEDEMAGVWKTYSLLYWMII